MLNAMCWEHEDLRAANVHCAAEHGWSGDEVVGRLGIVFVRQGHFRRREQGVEVLVDAGSWYIQRPNTEESTTLHAERRHRGPTTHTSC
ncbi:hypothetical protein HIJ39_21010 [Sulfobacillus sp. DSM 109850]|uniref:Uncharacterized protein n=1 Tax=Sulfobacillus harzensis TaxID=2729629 RepID=A0A7Y0L7L4_9FIRM|nr:hypothetical protein [Sulfobacillus harzensis]